MLQCVQMFNFQITHQMASPDQHSSVSNHGDIAPILIYAGDSHWCTEYILFPLIAFPIVSLFIYAIIV